MLWGVGLDLRSPNFAFLAVHDERLAVLGTQAERLFADDPNAALTKLRLFGELLAQRAAAASSLYSSYQESQAELLSRLLSRGILNRDGMAVVGAVTVLVLVYLIVNLIVDLLYGVLDPRISHD